MFRMTAQQIAEIAGGRLQGAGDATVAGVRPLEDAGPSDLAFLAKKELVEKAGTSRAAVLLTAWQVAGFAGAQVICKDPELALTHVLAALRAAQFPCPTGISTSAVISPRARLGQNVSVGAWSVIEDGAELGDGVVVYPLAYVGRNVHIGTRTVIHPHVTIGDGTRIGADCIVHPGAVIGDDGFGFIQREGRSIKREQVGGVCIGDNVEIGGLTSIDRGMIQDTVVENGVKIDKHCHVAHNCRIGEHSILAGYARMGGSVTIGRGAVMAAGSGIVDHKTIGDGAVLAAGTGSISDVKPGETVMGYPARPLREQLRINALEGKLPDMHRRLMELEKEVEALKKRLEKSK